MGGGGNDPLAAKTLLLSIVIMVVVGFLMTPINKDFLQWIVFIPAMLFLAKIFGRR